MIKQYFIVLLLLVTQPGLGQDKAFAKLLVDTLASPYFWGRGYTNNGMNKAAQFIGDQFSIYGLEAVSGKSYFQSFSYPVNTFPGNMQLRINGLELVPGKDFIVAPDSRSVRASGKLQAQDSAHFIDPENRIIVSLQDKLTWSVAGSQADYTSIQIDRKALAETPSTIAVNIKNKLLPRFKAANVCGWVKGTRMPDSVIVISAHYDHLGGMGKDTYFPGANDNASGTALLLGLASYYAKNPAPYTMAFISFAGEEAGLIGSKYFTENPLFPLKKIRFVVNLDLAGTGDEGITVVNATEFTNEYKLLNEVNDESQLLHNINARGKAANSDHYWFTEKGVPAFFFYTVGGIKAYHDVFDKAETLPLNEYDDLLKLITGFNKKLMR